MPPGRKPCARSMRQRELARSSVYSGARDGVASMQYRVLVAGALLALAGAPVATQPKGCEPDGKIQFICGIPSPEDLVPVPRSDWVVASGYIRGGVSLVNTKTFAATQVFPVAKPVERFDKATYAQCPGPVDPGEKDKLSAHGLAIRP